MSSILSVATVVEKNRMSSEYAFLICLDVDVVNPSTRLIDETLHVVNNTEDISWNGATYTAAKFTIELNQGGNSQPQINLSFYDYTGALQQRLEAYGGGVGFEVRVSIVNSSDLTLPAEIVETFKVISTSCQNYVVAFQLGAENALSKAFPRRIQTRDFCQARYKDPRTCKYAGSMATCDYTLKGANGCEAHSNVINFVAYPGLNDNGVRYS